MWQYCTGDLIRLLTNIYTWASQCIICLHAMTIILMNLELGRVQSVEDAPSNADVFSHWPDDVGCTVKHCITGSVSPIVEEEIKWIHQGLTEQSLQYLGFPSCLDKEMRMKLEILCTCRLQKKKKKKKIHERLTGILKWWYPWNLRWHVMHGFSSLT